MRTYAPIVAALSLGLVPASAAWAQSALVVRDYNTADNGLGTCNFGTEKVFRDYVAVENIPSADLATVSLVDYDILVLPECQGDDTYGAWNALIAKIEGWVLSGGLLLMKTSPACVGRVVTVEPIVPGGQPTSAEDLSNEGIVTPTGSGHPVFFGVPPTLSGTPVSDRSYAPTGSPFDEVLLTSTVGQPSYFVREHGFGTVVVSGMKPECYVPQCGLCYDPQGENHPHLVLANEAAWSATFPKCYSAGDADADGIPDDCDRCPAGDDLADVDLDLVADACDPCPNSNPDDVDQDGFCDDVDDSDGDGFTHYDDNCPNDANADQLDTDTDGVGDACDNCVNHRNPNQRNGDGDPNGDACDWCPGGHDFEDRDGDFISDHCDNCPDVMDENQVDRDDDGWGELCDCNDATNDVNPGVFETCDGLDNNCDDAVDEDTAIDATEWFEDLDRDGQGNAAVSSIGCYAPDGFVADDRDCDDGNPYVRRGSPEVCDGLDNDCDEVVDYDGCVLPEDREPEPDDKPKKNGSSATCAVGAAPGAAGVLPLLLLLIPAARRSRR